jgi:hypothetical protein
LPSTREAQSAMALVRAGRLQELQQRLKQVDEEIRQAAAKGLAS